MTEPIEAAAEGIIFGEAARLARLPDYQVRRRVAAVTDLWARLWAWWTTQPLSYRLWLAVCGLFALLTVWSVLR